MSIDTIERAAKLGNHSQLVKAVKNWIRLNRKLNTDINKEASASFLRALEYLRKQDSAASDEIY